MYYLYSILVVKEAVTQRIIDNNLTRTHLYRNYYYI